MRRPTWTAPDKDKESQAAASDDEEARERVDLGEVKMHWISGKDNPADIMTKAVDKATIDRLLPYLSGDKEIPLPDGLKIWFGPNKWYSSYGLEG